VFIIECIDLFLKRNGGLHSPLSIKDKVRTYQSQDKVRTYQSKTRSGSINHKTRSKRRINTRVIFVVFCEKEDKHAGIPASYLLYSVKKKTNMQEFRHHTCHNKSQDDQSGSSEHDCVPLVDSHGQKQAGSSKCTRSQFIQVEKAQSLSAENVNYGRREKWY